MVHYGWAKFAKNFKERGAYAPEEYYTLQFGGTGDDRIDTGKILG